MFVWVGIYLLDLSIYFAHLLLKPTDASPSWPWQQQQQPGQQQQSGQQQWRNDAADDGCPDTTDDHDGSVYERPELAEPAKPAEPEQPAATTTTSPSGQVDKVP